MKILHIYLYTYKFTPQALTVLTCGSWSSVTLWLALDVEKWWKVCGWMGHRVIAFYSLSGPWRPLLLRCSFALLPVLPHFVSYFCLEASTWWTGTVSKLSWLKSVWCYCSVTRKLTATSPFVWDMLNTWCNFFSNKLDWKQVT